MIKAGSICSRLNIRWVATLFSVLVTVLVIHKPKPFNYDFMVYYRAAQAYIEQGWHAAMAIYPWPFYSVLIAALSHWTSLSLLTSAHVLSVIFFIGISFFFMTLLKELGASRPVEWVGALVISFSPLLNTYRLMLIRDPGYWAFYLLSLLFFIRYFRQLTWRYNLAWVISMSIAMLFRIEGAIFLMLAPLIVLARTDLGFGQRCLYVLKAYTVPMLFCLMIGIFSLHQDGHLGRLQQVIDQVQHGFIVLYQTFQQHSALLAQSGALSIWSVEYARVFMIGGLLWFYGYILFKTINVFYLMIVSYGVAQRVIQDELGSVRVLWGYILINVILSLLFLGESFFLSDRYIFPIVLVLMLWLPFAVGRIYNNWKTQPKTTKLYQRSRVWLALLVLLFGSYVIGGIVYFFVNDKEAYIKSAGQWAQQTIPAQATVFTNESRLIVYMGRKGLFGAYALNFGPAALNQNYQTTWSHYDYLMMNLEGNVTTQQQALTTVIGHPPLRIFRTKDRAVVVYTISH